MRITRGTLRACNLCLLSILCVLFIIYFLLSLTTTSQVSELEIISKPSTVTTTKTSKEALEEAFSQPFLNLKTNRMDARVPDLRQHLIYHGSNCRPDIDASSGFVRMGFRGINKSFSVHPNSKVYLKYQQQGPNRWSVAESGETTSLWIEIHPQGREATVKVFLQDHKGQIIHSPDELATFRVQAVPPPQHEQISQAFNIGSYHVDNSLLINMGAIWYGKDALYTVLDDNLEKASKELIFLGHEGDSYSILSGLDDCFIFEEGKFIPVIPGPSSLTKPLLKMTMRDDNQLQFTIWDISGQFQLNLVLHRTQAPPFSPTFPLKLIGARSRLKLIAELANKRTLIDSDEWLLQTKEGIIPIKSQETLDSYTQGVLRGTLLALNGIKKVDNKQVLTGILIDPSRTIWQEFTMHLYRTQNSNEKNRGNPKKYTDDDDDDDDDLLDDDDDDDDDSDVDLLDDNSPEIDEEDDET